MATKLEARVNEHDRQIAAIRKLILSGMKMMNEIAAAQREFAAETRKAIKELHASQRETDRMLRSLIDSLKRGGSNGHQKRRPVE